MNMFSLRRQLMVCFMGLNPATDVSGKLIL